MKKAIIGLVAGMLIGSAGMAAAATTPTVQAVLGKFSFSVDGQKQTLKNDPLVYKGTTYLPIREVAEMTGYELEYDSKAKSIDLQSKGENKMTEQNVNPNKSKFEEVTYSVGQEFVIGKTTLKLTSVTYSKDARDGATSGAGFVASTGEKFALIRFDVLTTAEPKDRFTWSANDFFSSVNVGGKVLQGGNSTGESTRIKPGERKSVEIFVSIPEDMEVSSVKFSEPGNYYTIAKVDL